MAQANDQTQLVGTFKDVWGDNVVEAFKFAAPISSRVGFETAQLVGGKFHQPVDLQMEHGFVYAASAASVTLATPIAGYLADAQVTGSQMYGRSEVSYEAMMRSQSDKQAVKEATKHVVRRLGLSATKRLEVQMLHGQKGIGIAGTLATEGGSFTTVVTLSDASWAAGIWAGMENAQVDIYDTTLATKRNLVSAADLAVTISAVNVAAKQVTLSYATARASWDSTFAATDVFFFRTAKPSTEFAGIDTISQNTGTLFNISATTYALWGGNIYSSTGTLSMSKLLDALSLPASFGLMSATAIAVVSPKAFEVLNSDQAALRQFGVNYRSGSAESGFEGLVYHGQTGKLEVLPHPFQKDGQANVFVPEEAKRIGASDLSFIDRGGPQPRLILESANNPASEMRIQSHQAVLLECPRHTVALTGITY